MTLHPLVEKIRWMPRRTEFSLEDLGNVDKIIREYLEEKAAELSVCFSVGNADDKHIDKILDLSPKEEKIEEIEPLNTTMPALTNYEEHRLKHKLNELIRAVNELRSK